MHCLFRGVYSLDFVVDPVSYIGIQKNLHYDSVCFGHDEGNDLGITIFESEKILLLETSMSSCDPQDRCHHVLAQLQVSCV